MDSLLLTGTNASGLLCPPDGLAIEVRNIQIDIPLNEVGTTDPTVTLSGTYTGVTTVHNDIDVKVRFGYNECVHISSTLPTDEYSTVINYVKVGDMGCNEHTLEGMRPNFITNRPWRFR